MKSDTNILHNLVLRNLLGRGYLSEEPLSPCSLTSRTESDPRSHSRTESESETGSPHASPLKLAESSTTESQEHSDSEGELLNGVPLSDRGNKSNIDTAEPESETAQKESESTEPEGKAEDVNDSKWLESEKSESKIEEESELDSITLSSPGHIISSDSEADLQSPADADEGLGTSIIIDKHLYLSEFVNFVYL